MDILDKLGKEQRDTSVEGAASAAPNQQAESSASGELDRGEDMLGRVGSQVSDSNKAASASQKNTNDSLENKTSSGQVEPTRSETVQDPDSWSKDSALKEIKKLRDEAKATRLKYSEQLDQFRAEQDAKEELRKAEIAEALKAKEELDKIKAEQEDKKRDTEQKLAHRESKLAELQALSEAQAKEFERQKREMEDRLSSFEASRQAEMAIQKERLDGELNKIPEQYREHAELIVKGAGDPRDALVALHEAKLKGMFEDKTVIVDHSVPGAKDGARSSKEKLDAAAGEARKSMSSSQKIKSALDAMKQGQSNSAFRGK